MVRYVFSILVCSLMLATDLMAYQYDLALCTCFQSEAPYLKEWIEFHKLQGVQHFYLFDNLSEDRPENVLSEYTNCASECGSHPPSLYHARNP